jgi:hypothetical protein
MLDRLIHIAVHVKDYRFYNTSKVPSALFCAALKHQNEHTRVKHLLGAPL